MTRVFTEDGTLEVVPYGDDWMVASRVCRCRHLNNEHQEDGRCEVCVCVSFRPGGDRVEP